MFLVKLLWNICYFPICRLNFCFISKEVSSSSKKKNYIWVTLLCSSKFSKRHCYVAQNLSVLQFYKLLSDCLVSFSICFFKWLSLVFPLSLAFEIHYEFFNDIVQSSISLSLQSFFPSFFCFKTYFWIFVLFFLSYSKWQSTCKEIHFFCIVFFSRLGSMSVLYTLFLSS